MVRAVDNCNHNGSTYTITSEYDSQGLASNSGSISQPVKAKNVSLGKNNIPVPIPTSLKVPVEKGTRNLVVTRAFEAGPGRLGQLQNLTETGASHVGEVEPVASDHVRDCHLQVSIVSGNKQTLALVTRHVNARLG